VRATRGEAQADADSHILECYRKLAVVRPVYQDPTDWIDDANPPADRRMRRRAL